MRYKYWLITFFIFLGFSVLAQNKVDLNTASLEELQKIVWVGKATAQKIIEARPFNTVDDLIKVSGIGEKKLSDIKNQGLAWVGGTTTISSTKPAFIDINTASLEALTSIIHIGTSRANEIVNQRPFYTLDDLLRVKGIGDKTLQDIKAQGLAWVDPSLEPPVVIKEAIDKPIELNTNYKLINKPTSLIPFFFAFILAIFSIVIVLKLKKGTDSLD